MEVNIYIFKYISLVEIITSNALNFVDTFLMVRQCVPKHVPVIVYT